MPFCEACGKEVTPDALFCENCGAKISEQSDNQSDSAPSKPLVVTDNEIKASAGNNQNQTDLFIIPMVKRFTGIIKSIDYIMRIEPDKLVFLKLESKQANRLIDAFEDKLEYPDDDSKNRKELARCLSETWFLELYKSLIEEKKPREDKTDFSVPFEEIQKMEVILSKELFDNVVITSTQEISLQLWWKMGDIVYSYLSPVLGNRIQFSWED